jgi:hypothetical protein
MCASLAQGGGGSAVSQHVQNRSSIGKPTEQDYQEVWLAADLIFITFDGHRCPAPFSDIVPCTLTQTFVTAPPL